MQTIELISFKLCPFVQRSVITLLKKGVDFKITYIDLANKPDWFLQLSPLGKVPVVKYGDQVLFESAVINEFLDEITPDQIMPIDALQKAKDRGWIEYSSQIIMDQYRMTVAKTAEDYETHSGALNQKLQRLEMVVNGEYFSGDKFSLVDAAIAPVLSKFAMLQRYYQVDFLSELPKLAALTTKLVNFDFVKKSVVDDFEPLFDQYLRDNGSYLTQSK
ncbi:glutathione S-transferase ['Osedax' symbiont bacterium Rs2_46_30_T18]|nr:glutathione S-transferase ['Osedax' symbiont bacterium Rs2_46_30_T18]